MGKYRDHRSSPGDRFDDGRELSEPSYFQRREETRASVPVASVVASTELSKALEAEILWFNLEKGFGFVRLSDCTDAFLHASKLQTVGLTNLPEGMKLQVIVEVGTNGKPQVSKVLSTAGGGDTNAPSDKPGPATVADTGEQESLGTVKRYDAVKGFGFLKLEDGGKDVFVHATTVARCGLAPLEAGQKIVVSYVQGHKGLEARSLRRI